MKLSKTLIIPTLCFGFITSIQAAISVVDDTKIRSFPGNTDGQDTTPFTVTGGDLLVVATNYDAGVDSILDGTVSVSFGGVAMTSVSSVFRPDGEVGSGIFYILNPTASTGQVSIDWGVNSTGHNGLVTTSILTFSGVDIANPFGSLNTNTDKSTGVVLSDVEAGNLSIYSVAANQGLGVPPLRIDGVNAAGVTGFINLGFAESGGARLLQAGMVQQTTGSVAFTHIQSTRDASAIALEINAAPVPEPSSTLLLGMGALGLIARRKRF